MPGGAAGEQHDDPRASRDELLAIELARGQTRADAAANAGVSERTVYSRLGDPEFVARVQELRRLAVTEAIGKLSSTTGEAADTLKELLTASEGVDAEGNEIPDNKTRLGAARGIFGDLIRLVEFARYGDQMREFEERLRKVEEQRKKKQLPGR